MPNSRFGGPPEAAVSSADKRVEARIATPPGGCSDPRMLGRETAREAALLVYESPRIK